MVQEGLPYDVDENVQSSKDREFIESFPEHVKGLKLTNPELYEALSYAGLVKEKYDYNQIIDVFAFMESFNNSPTGFSVSCPQQN